MNHDNSRNEFMQINNNIPINNYWQYIIQYHNYIFIVKLRDKC